MFGRILLVFMSTLYILTDLTMDPSEHDGDGALEALPPPPPVPPNVTPLKVEPEPESKKVLRVPMARLGFGTRGNRVPILTNHFKVNVASVDGHFFHYSVCMQENGLFSCSVFAKPYDCSL